MLPDHDYHDPFEYLEEIWTALSGENAHIFKALETEKTVSGDTITWHLRIPEGNVCLYGNLPTQESIPSTLWAGSDEPVAYAQWLSPTVFTIPFEKGESTVGVVLSSEKPFAADDEQFYALDLDRLQELADQIKEGAEQVTDLTMENGKISCTVNAREGEKLFLNISRTTGWNIFVNGSKVESEEFAYCLSVIPLSEGENRIEMNYRVPNLRRGIAMTVAGVLLLAFYEVRERRKRRRAGTGAE